MENNTDNRLNDSLINLSKLRNFKHRTKWVFLCLSLLFTVKSFTQSTDSLQHYYYSIFQDVQSPTNFLFNLGFIYPDRIAPFVLSDSADLSSRIIVTNAHKWRNTYTYLKNSIVDSTAFYLPQLGSFYVPAADDDPHVNIGVVFMDGEYIEPDSIEKYFDQSVNKIPADIPKKEVNILSISNLRESVVNQNVIFQMNPALFFTNRPDPVSGLEINFDDGTGNHFYPFNYTDIPVSYDLPGEKNITFKLVTSSDTLICYSTILIRSTKTLVSDEGYAYADLSDGTTTHGSYEIYLGCDQVLDKPFIVVEGFDPAERNKPRDKFDKYDSAGVWDYLRAFGYDLVSLKFDKNHDKVENNAQVVKALIDLINTQKTGHFENIIIAESMGGLATRIALAEMESANTDHEVGLYISFDSPHGGANIPLSIQQLGHDFENLEVDSPILPDFVLNFFSDLLSLSVAIFEPTDIKRTIHANDSPAAKEMLVRHYTAAPDQLNPDFVAFKQYLQTVGFPKVSRNIALINGSNIAEQQNFNGDTYLEKSDEVSCVYNFSAYSKVSPVSQTAQVSSIYLKFGCSIFGWTPINQKGIFTFFDKPYDYAPGGIIENSKLSNAPSFMPSISGIDLADNLANGIYGLFYFNENSQDMSRHKKFIVQNNYTPFDDIYSGNLNTQHTSLALMADQMNEIKEREFMFSKRYLQNRIFKDGWIRQFHAEDSIVAGRNVNPWQEKEIENGAVIAEAGTNLDITAGQSIRLLPGVKIENGASFHAYIQNDAISCPPTSNKEIAEENENVYKKIVPTPIISRRQTGNDNVFSVSNRLKDAISDDYSWTLRGDKEIIRASGFDFSVKDLKEGQYSITCSLFKGARVSSKIFSVAKIIPSVNDRGNTAQIQVPVKGTSVLVYPNPAVDEISVRYSLEKAGRVRLEMINLLNQHRIMLADSYQQTGLYTRGFNIREFNSGMYLLLFSFDGKQIAEKVIVQK